MSSTTHDAERAAAAAIGLIAQGIQALRVATDGHDGIRAREFTRALRQLVGAGPRDENHPVWTRVLRAEREHAVARLLANGAATEDVARMCWMSPERVRQIAAASAGTHRRATGRPAGRPTKATTEPEAAA